MMPRGEAFMFKIWGFTLCFHRSSMYSWAIHVHADLRTERNPWRSLPAGVAFSLRQSWAPARLPAHRRACLVCPSVPRLPNIGVDGNVWGPLQLCQSVTSTCDVKTTWWGSDPWFPVCFPRQSYPHASERPSSWLITEVWLTRFGLERLHSSHLSNFKK